MHTQDIELTTFSSFRPTQSDCVGLGSEGCEDWLLCPVMQTRDSGTLDRSNFRTMERLLECVDPDVKDHDVHRFGHWGPGWFEILIVRPGTEAHRVAQESACALSDYPVLDEMDYSELEHEIASEYWESMSTKERMEVCARYGVSVFAARRDYIPSEDSGEIYTYLADGC